MLQTAATANGWAPEALVDRLWRLLRYGTEAYPKIVSRRLRILNGLSAVALLTSMVFAVRYAMVEWNAHLVLSTWAFTIGAVWGFTPLFNRFGASAPVIYFVIVGVVGLVLGSHLAGSSAGIHYFLLVAPAMSLLLGLRYAALSLSLAALGVAAFILVEFGFPYISEIAPLSPEAAKVNKLLAVTSAMAIVAGAILYATVLGERAEEALEHEYERSENLLLNLMPAPIAARLKDKPDETIADHFDSVTILFADIVDFTPRASALPPDQVVQFLTRVFSAFDRLAEQHRVEKIKTIGDAYMVAAGIPEPREDHATAMADMALDMLAEADRLSRDVGESLDLRIGLHTGPAIAGVIGTRRPFYDVWGDTVNTAARMESHGNAGRIQVTRQAAEAIGDGHIFQPRGSIVVKGKGEMEVLYLTGRRSRTLRMRDADARLRPAG